MDIRIVFVTCPPGAGADLLRQLIEERLVAGGNLVTGVRSLYRWKDAVQDEAEEILWMETSAGRVTARMSSQDTAKRPSRIARTLAPTMIAWAPRGDAP